MTRAIAAVIKASHIILGVPALFVFAVNNAGLMHKSPAFFCLS
ncbi:hypothetical protein PS947_05275 [Pseudomonas fluorescens]|nr:hypothetical protein PS947_05275 [Pseudomonas fluorescens]